MEQQATRDLPAPTPAADSHPSLVCKVCGGTIEALTVADGREVLDLVRFHERHASCLAQSAAQLTTHL